VHDRMMIEKLVQFTHLEKLYGYLPGMDESLMARLFGLGLEEYRETKGRFEGRLLFYATGCKLTCRTLTH
jgi:acyl-CoA thioesterase I